MEVILRTDIKGLGDKHSVVRVKDGYGRNYLLPKGLAYLATPSHRKNALEVQKQTAHKRAKQKEDALALAKQIRDTHLVIEVSASEKGNIYGSVTATHIINELRSHNLVFERKDVRIAQPIKSLGKHEVTILLHKEVEAPLTLEVQSQSAPAPPKNKAAQADSPSKGSSTSAE